MSSIQNYVAANASLPPEMILGNISWFEVNDGRYDADKLEISFIRHNLNDRFLPPRINPTDAYEKASKAAHGLKYTVTMPDGSQATAEILVRDVSRTNSQIVRHLIREVKDADNKSLAYDKVGEMVFYRPALRNNRVDHASANVRTQLEPGLTPQEHALLVQHLAQFDADYDRYRKYHDGQKMRGVLREYLRYLNAVPMKASVYFVHGSRVDELVRLQKFCAETEGLNLTLWQIPDVQHHRDQVIDAYQVEVEKDAAGLVATITKLRESRLNGISPAQYLKFKEEYDATVRRAAEWGRTLDVSQDRTESALELAAEALVALQADVYKSLNGDEEV